MLCTTPACFSTFFQATMVPTLAENSLILSVLVVYDYSMKVFYRLAHQGI